MNPVSAASLDLARELLALEAVRGRKSAEATGGADVVVRVCKKLQRVLTAFAGNAGFRSLLARALTVAKAQDPSLFALQVLEDGSLAGLETLHDENNARSSKKTRNGAPGQILVAQLLDLLVIFIGEPLMLQLLRSAWPDAPPGAVRARTKDTR